MTYYKRKVGLRAEDLACRVLEQEGYKLICRNYRSRFGEVDIIAIDGDTVVFVEVKFRSSRRFGLPEEAVTRRKLERVRSLGYLFWRKNFPYIRKARVDVVTLEKRGGRFMGRIIKGGAYI